MAGPRTQAHLDVLARQMGFPDYATYSAYQTHQQAMRMSNGINGQNGPAQGAQPPANWLQTLINKYTPLGAVANRLNQVLP